MEAATLPEEQQQAPESGGPAEGAEATRTMAHLFEYSRYVHAGVGSDECEHGEDGKCEEVGHFHAWVCLPNSIQHRDILEKARAAKARRRRALQDTGGDGRLASDANVMLEADLDDVMGGTHEDLLNELAQRNVRKRGVERVNKLISDDDRFTNYWQDAEEFQRLGKVPEEQRNTDEFESLRKTVEGFDEALQASADADRERELAALRSLGDDQLRSAAREARIDGEAAEAHLHAYYLWMGFVCTRVPSATNNTYSKRYFQTLEDLRNSSPEVVDVIDEAMNDLEGRMGRGGASGN